MFLWTSVDLKNYFIYILKLGLENIIRVGPVVWKNKIFVCLQLVFDTLITLLIAFVITSSGFIFIYLR